MAQQEIDMALSTDKKYEIQDTSINGISYKFNANWKLCEDCTLWKLKCTCEKPYKMSRVLRIQKFMVENDISDSEMKSALQVINMMPIGIKGNQGSSQIIGAHVVDYSAGHFFREDKSVPQRPTASHSVSQTFV